MLAYATAERVVGLTMLPLDGNPNRSMGLIAHPSEVAAIAVGAAGKNLLTAGGRDGAVNLWRIDEGAVERLVEQGGQGMVPFHAMLEGGKDGPLYQEISDYFVYAQLRAQGEDAMEARAVGPTMPLSELANVLRALGYYPTEQEVRGVGVDLCLSYQSWRHACAAQVKGGVLVWLCIMCAVCSGLLASYGACICVFMSCVGPFRWTIC